jgi:hypothetical protein
VGQAKQLGSFAALPLGLTTRTLTVFWGLLREAHNPVTPSGEPGVSTLQSFLDGKNSKDKHHNESLRDYFRKVSRTTT